MTSNPESHRIKKILIQTMEMNEIIHELNEVLAA